MRELAKSFGHVFFYSRKKFEVCLRSIVVFRGLSFDLFKFTCKSFSKLLQGEKSQKVPKIDFSFEGKIGGRRL